MICIPAVKRIVTNNFFERIRRGTGRWEDETNLIIGKAREHKVVYGEVVECVVWNTIGIERKKKKGAKMVTLKMKICGLQM